MAVGEVQKVQLLIKRYEGNCPGKVEIGNKANRGAKDKHEHIPGKLELLGDLAKDGCHMRHLSPAALYMQGGAWRGRGKLGAGG